MESSGVLILLKSDKGLEKSTKGNTEIKGQYVTNKVLEDFKGNKLNVKRHKRNTSWDESSSPSLQKNELITPEDKKITKRRSKSITRKLKNFFGGKDKKSETEENKSSKNSRENSPRSEKGNNSPRKYQDKKVPIQTPKKGEEKKIPTIQVIDDKSTKIIQKEESKFSPRSNQKKNNHMIKFTDIDNLSDSVTLDKDILTYNSKEMDKIISSNKALSPKLCIILNNLHFLLFHFKRITDCLIENQNYKDAIDSQTFINKYVHSISNYLFTAFTQTVKKKKIIFYFLFYFLFFILFFIFKKR